MSIPGGIILKFHRLAANFGRLKQQTLELQDGLNILQAPNESGKSTWCAFLTAMLYGISSRERDRAAAIAEKNRYAPWDGSPMQGRLDCTDSGGRELTLMRATVRDGAPMGAFRALYTGTGEPVPALTGANCGETLLGVPREVFERSAFIRQAGLPVTADPELERRIAALITSGEEGVSCSEASAALKLQLHRRRFNQRGELPGAEADLAALREKLDIMARQRQTLLELRQQTEALSARLAETEEQLTRWQRRHAAEALRQQEELTRQLQQAQAAADALRSRLETEHVPENEAISRLRGAIVNLETVRKSVEKAREDRDEALKALLQAEAAVSESPFTGQTPEQACREAQSSAPGRVSGGVSLRELSIFFLFLALGAAGTFWAMSRCSGLDSPLFRLLPWTVLAVMTAAGWYVSRLYRRHTAQVQWDAARRKRFGAADPAAIAAMAETYARLYQAREEARAEADRRSAAADSLYATLSANEQAILLEVRRFAPTAFTIPAADQLLRNAARQRRELTEAETAVREARLRLELTGRRIPAAPLPSSVQPPRESEETLTARREELQRQLTDLRRQTDHLSGQIAAAGDPDVLAARAEQLECRIRQLSGEYDALALALEVLTAANADLQNRFSPALGRRAAEIFRQLTGGRYTGVALDRAFRLSAEPAGDTLYRDARLLSAGALDQLYLAVRLAVCQLVLPEEKNIPLVLDDALANFDDARCAAALDWLRREAEHRQILLFTCHSREAAHFRDDPAVRIARLE
ncbi:ATP-binding protein [Dysosmobacter sp.]|uniref:ATP-binding protein n=1 Tax=Dysosmobacter sp. TaxID=2591382 RepID=UPI002A8E8A08|nr:AAA family ATPase [Dysosmobacter sp.]MDY3280749.1 AAA family ATPase [Dysosmobacter sp.]